MSPSARRPPISDPGNLDRTGCQAIYGARVTVQSLASVTEDTGHYDVSLCCQHDDGRELIVAVSSGDQLEYQTLTEAQRGADQQLHILGHACSALCEQWPRAVTHKSRVMTTGASFNVLEYYGEPKEAALVWSLTKGLKRARCALWTHPIGAELRVEAAGEFRTQPGWA